MPAQLLALTGGPSILLDKPILLLGRHPECDIQIDSRKVSRRHCCIAQVDDYLVVRDLGSTNGIRINGVRVLEGRLHAGDELTIGNSRYQVRWEGPPAAAPAAPKAAVVPPRRPPPANPVPRPALPAQLPDDLLEDFDDPVALAEPADAPAPAPRARARPAPAAEPSSPPPPAKAPPRSDDADAPIVPDHLHLRPSSDIFPAASSPSHHPE